MTPAVLPITPVEPAPRAAVPRARVKAGPRRRRALAATSPWPDREAIEREQLAKLRRLLKLARQSPFYRAKLAALDGVGPLASLAEFAGRVPFTRKEELADDQQRHPPYGSILTLPLARYTRCHQTSGSTGRPLRWLDTPESWRGLLDNWRQILDAAGVTAGDRFLFAFSFGPFVGFWSAMESAVQRGCFCLASGAMTSEARSEAIRDHRITVLGCTPTYAVRLGEVARAHAVPTDSVRLIIVAGEPGGSIPATRARLKELWSHARVFDHHGMTEVGPVTCECPAEPGVLHVIESAYLPEVVEPESGAPAPDGAAGELVLTTLDRLGSPVVRYRTGDLVRRRPPGRCACGRCDTALVGGILGRTDDMVIVRGVNVFPSAVEHIVRACGGVTEYRVHVGESRGLAELRVDIEPAPDVPDAARLAASLEQGFQKAFALRIPVRLVPPGTLPRFEMKAQRWVRRTG